MAELIEKLIKKEVLSQKAYTTEAPSCPIRLDANENTLPLPEALHDKLMDALGRVPLNRYPELGSPSLAARYAKACGVESNMALVGNGSDELIQVLCTALAPSAVLIPAPTFVMYRITALNNGHRVIEVPLNGEFDLDLEALLGEMEKERPGLIFLSYPNNPTGNCFSAAKIEALLKKAPGLVVVDEAYGNFSGKSFLPLLKEYENLVILRTLSKIGLAAMRIGFLLGRPSLIGELNKVRLPYNLNSLSQIGAFFYLENEGIFLEQAAGIVQRREALYLSMQRMAGLTPYPTDANFIFFSCVFDTDRVYNELVREGVLVKNFGNAGPLRNCMRVTVGTQEENERFLGALKRIMAKLGA